MAYQQTIWSQYGIHVVFDVHRTFEMAGGLDPFEFTTWWSRRALISWADYHQRTVTITTHAASIPLGVVSAELLIKSGLVFVGSAEHLIPIAHGKTVPKAGVLGEGTVLQVTPGYYKVGVRSLEPDFFDVFLQRLPSKFRGDAPNGELEVEPPSTINILELFARQRHDDDDDE